MRTSYTKFEAFERFTTRLACSFVYATFHLLLLGLLLGSGFTGSSLAQGAKPKMFASPGAATTALFQAVERDDEQALEAILGAGKDVTSSGDEIQDKAEREQFTQKYQEMHRLVRDRDGTSVLYIGAENWPFPIPLVSKNGRWYFDSDHGKQEILFRRIGENEMTAIEVCQEFAIAKNAAGAKAASEDPVTRFAENLVSAGAANPDSKESNLFQGYYFRIVKDSASEVSGHTTQGELTLVAYPAEYKSSGVKTFVVTRKGVVFEKDLGPGTTTLAPELKVRAGSNWHLAA
jgi:hypothetical protein